jgi:thiosulfate/3-mercaptopyruvate sulfurtransferase
VTTYAHPEVLVETDWVQQNLDNPTVKLVEVDVDTTSYDAGHIPGAIGFNWRTQLQDQIIRDIISKEAFETLLGDAGISPDDTVVLYGDNNNWFAAYGFWLFKIYGHKDVRLMNGGRVKWLNEPGKPLTTEKPHPQPVQYRVSEVNLDLRAKLSDVMEAISGKGEAVSLVDVRSPDEFTGKIIAPPNVPEAAQRGGHLPHATNIPWSMAVQENGVFKTPEELRALYIESDGINPQRPTIAYCRIGERSSHTWFVLRYLLGMENVKNHDGSWTEYGNLVGVPIEK